MKLLQVWNVTAISTESPVSVWARFSVLTKPPKVAMLLCKYIKKINSEFKMIEAYRQECMYAASGQEPGTDVRIEPGTPEHSEFCAKFSEFLNGESDIDPAGISMDALIEALASEKGNRISEADLELLEPFFVEKSKPDLKVVETA
mgnify:CR=1 FL=1